MGRLLLELPEEVQSALLAHLLPPSARSEEAAFVFAKAMVKETDTVFTFVEWMPVAQDGFVQHSGYYFELTDKTRGGVIKRAHDLGASLVEFHSHLSSRPASFSDTDIEGLRQFVPHVWWRLKGKPYMAVVIAPKTFDALAWRTDPKAPEAVCGILVGGSLLRPTGLTLKDWKDPDDAQST
jgi:hypothetical protein